MAISQFHLFYIGMTVSVSQNALKQPAPNIISNNQQQAKKVPKMPNVGVVSVPKISKTPLEDTITLKKQENPHTVYKIYPNKKNSVKGYLLSTFGIIICGLLAYRQMRKK